MAEKKVDQGTIIPFVIEDSAKLPEYKSEGASGADVYACLKEPVVLAPGEYKLIPTGLSCAIPEGYEIQVRPRSGLAAKNGVTLLNTPGTIDSDYRGEIKIILINLGKEPFTVKDKDRIAQFVVAPVVKGYFKAVTFLDNTDRGQNGFGSTGV
ncbi:dUTP diphosphatase [Treponema parvum]|uniref:Deoxyuridine 5'-triphosphate nucleotidohydrolase n=1 Tax=Treponema parvum TaxID=138851 RepID=A0A975F355_9SPIR|nr:dUTP diphosphatase [Treponema parvum]QTQ13654.1 dUTP diphosphatase [Treponema parvum]